MILCDLFETALAYTQDNHRALQNILSLAFDPDLDINALVFHKHDSNNQLRNRYLNAFEK
jgi:hypothetical protein